MRLSFSIVPYAFLAWFWISAFPALAELPSSWNREQDELRRQLTPALDSSLASQPRAETLSLARYTFIHLVGADALETLAKDPTRRDFLDALYGDLKALETFNAMVNPPDRVGKALAIYGQLWMQEQPERRRRYNNLMLGIAFLWDNDYGANIGSGASWKDGVITVISRNHGDDVKKGKPETETEEVTPEKRYAWYRDRWEEDRLLTDVDELESWEMKFTVNLYRPQEDLEWAITKFRQDRPEVFGKTTAEFADKRAKARQEIGWKAYYAVPYIYPWGPNMGRHLAEMTQRGAVCGGQSDFAQAVANANGVPAAKMGCTGHGYMAFKGSPGGWCQAGWYNWTFSDDGGYRDDFLEHGSYAKAGGHAYLTLLHTPEMRGDAWLAANRGYAMAKLARDLGKKDEEKRWLMLTAAACGRNIYVLERIARRYWESLKANDGFATAKDWSRLVDIVEKSYLGAENADANAALPNCIVGWMWSREEEFVKPKMPKELWLQKITTRRERLMARFPNRGDLLLRTINQEIEAMKAAGIATDTATHLLGLIKGSDKEGIVAALGQTLLESVKGNPVKTDAYFNQTMLRLAQLPVSNLDARANAYRSMSKFVGFGSAPVIGEWTPPQIQAEKQTTLRMPLPAMVGKQSGSQDVQLLLVPTGGASVIRFHAVKLLADGGSVVEAKPEKAWESKSGADPIRLTLKLAEPNPAKRYELEIVVSGGGGKDTAGRVAMTLRPTPAWDKASGVGGFGKEMFDGQPKPDWKTVTFGDITRQVKESGPGWYYFRMKYDCYDRGRTAWLAIFKEGQKAPLAGDFHPGTAGGDGADFAVYLPQGSYSPGDKIVVKGKMYPFGGWGTLLMAPRPAPKR